MNLRCIKYPALVVCFAWVCHAFTGGEHELSVTGAKDSVSLPGGPKTFYVYNTGTSTVYFAFGGHVVLTNLASEFPVAAGAALTMTDAEFTYVSWACKTNEASTIDYGYYGE